MIASSPSPTLHASGSAFLSHYQNPQGHRLPRSPRLSRNQPCPPSSSSRKSPSLPQQKAVLKVPSSTTHTVVTTPSSNTSYASSTSPEQDNSVDNIAQQPQIDAGTQYSPPDWPPTSNRSSIRTQPKSLLSTSTSQVGAPSLPTKDPTLTVALSDPVAPSEPRLRVIPHPQNTSRRSHSTLSDSSHDRSLTEERPAQRPRRHHDTPVKTLPRNYTECEPRELGNLIASLLMDLVQHNDTIPLKDDSLTRFHSRSAPAISIHDYMTRLIFHATLSTPILLSMLVYIDKLCPAFPQFNINSLTVHRFLITAATVASKGLSDVFWTNSTYAKVGGVGLKELAILEIELLQHVDWRIIPTPEALVTYYQYLIERTDNVEMEGTEYTDDGSGDVSSDEPPLT